MLQYQHRKNSIKKLNKTKTKVKLNNGLKEFNKIEFFSFNFTYIYKCLSSKQITKRVEKKRLKDTHTKNICFVLKNMKLNPNQD